MTLKVGIVEFINTAPFYVPWKEKGSPSGWEVVEGAPTKLNELLKKGAIQAGLISSFSYGENFLDYSILPDISISATGPVGSVMLLSEEPISSLRGATITVTTRSATSVMLLRIILEEFLGLGRGFRLLPGTLEDAKTLSSPYLAIGDEALRLARSAPARFRYDLAKVWMDYTSTPFVFAVLAVRKDVALRNPRLFNDLYWHIISCLDKGKKDLGRISEIVAPRIPMDPEDCLSYLKGIEFDLGEEKRQGLMRFFRILYELGVYKNMPEIDIFKDHTTGSITL